jgi:molybdopterin-containing oxidoreductase family iron-sulfur binding subunit
LEQESIDVLLLNNVNPIFALPPDVKVEKTLERDSLFVVSFSNFMDETSRQADLIIPTLLLLERWDEYGGLEQIVGTLQPATGSLNGAPHVGDLLLGLAFDEGSRPAKDFRSYLYAQLAGEGLLANELEWVAALQQGGLFKTETAHTRPSGNISPDGLKEALDGLAEPAPSAPVLVATPSLRFYDGRGANRPWLCEIPDPLSKVAWQTPVLAHGETLRNKGLEQGDLIEIESKWGVLEAPVYETSGVNPAALVMSIGQGHTDYGRYAAGQGLNPLLLMGPDLEPVSGAPRCSVGAVEIRKSGSSMELAHTDGSRTQMGRKIALSIDVRDLAQEQTGSDHATDGHEFPLTLPLPEGYDRTRDIYPPHDHDGYRWAMVVDLDRCIGCGACSAACYAENNIGVVGEERILEGREMSWIEIQRYLDTEHPERITFLPMLCQHCDNAPCESVCPVYAPHHSKEGLNNQIYNRCIGTRFCAQNCPYKVRRFNWFDYEWPEPLNLQLNPNVTVRSKGVMEKCSFCIQRIKVAHGIAKDENREIRDGEIQPACLQTCPTGVFTFGNLMDRNSLVRRQVTDRRAYQILGYLNTKPAVIYLKKITQAV